MVAPTVLKVHPLQFEWNRTGHWIPQRFVRRVSQANQQTQFPEDNIPYAVLLPPASYAKRLAAGQTVDN